MKIKFEDLILFEDDDFLVINKPPFVSTLADRNETYNIQSLAQRFNPDLTVCHRLDKETSGALLLAKSQEAYRHASLQFEHRTIEKVYHAVVMGQQNFESERLDLPILPLAKGVVKIDFRKGKEAATIFKTLEVYRNHTLVECKPITGRMHQIRIHLAWKKASIVNDTQYGGELLYLSRLKRGYNLKRETEEQPLIKRFALHAHMLSFETFKEKKNVVADYPKDFEVLVKQLRKNQR